MMLTRNTSTESAREYWKFIDHVAKNVASRPQWQGGDGEKPPVQSPEKNVTSEPKRSAAE